jgi:D-sedoheptulose 7-phosphate isomerase
MYQDLIRNELNEAAETLANFLKDEPIFTHSACRRSCWLTASKPVVKLSCGNGGSHCDAMHFAKS